MLWDCPAGAGRSAPIELRPEQEDQDSYSSLPALLSQRLPPMDLGGDGTGAAYVAQLNAVCQFLRQEGFLEAEKQLLTELEQKFPARSAAATAAAGTSSSSSNNSEGDAARHVLLLVVGGVFDEMR